MDEAEDDRLLITNCFSPVIDKITEIREKFGIRF